MKRIQVKSELNASVAKVEVAVGAAVGEGDSLILLESMKMEIPVTAPLSGRVAQILVKDADSVSEGQLLAVIEA